MFRVLGRLGAVLGRFEPSWGRLGIVLGCLESVSGPSCGRLGGSRQGPGGVLGGPGGVRSASCVYPDASYSYLSVNVKSIEKPLENQ